MLYPQQNAARLCVAQSGLWDFCLSHDLNAGDIDPAAPLPEARPMAVPASYNDQGEDKELRDHYGWAFYQREITLPALCAGQRAVLRFGAVTHHARVWLDGKLIAEHKGGFLPFEADVTGLLTPGTPARLTVACDNRVDHSTLPIGNEPGQIAFFGSDNAGIPSVEHAKATAAPQNRPNFDFFNFAGIHRPVWLYTTPAAYIRDITLVPHNDGRVEYSIDTVGDGEPWLKVLAPDGTAVASAKGNKGTLTVPDPQLWEPWPGTPNLYTLQVSFGDDRYDQTFGFREIKVEGVQVLLNGKPVYFKGFGKHEDSAFHGRGLDDCLNVKDVNLLHWLGANAVRTSHYPYSEEFYALCDREGILVIDETPAVGIGAGAAQDPYKTFPIAEHHRDVLRDMIDRDKNHPCVIMWSLGNEPDLEHFPQSAYDYWRPLYEMAHQLDPQDRPVTLVCCQNDYTKDITTRTMDVVCLNRYYGWYNLSGDLDAACAAWNEELDFWAGQGKPVMFTEYGADTVEGLHDTRAGMFSEEYQAEYFERINAEIDKRPFFVGELLWNFADFATIQGPMRVGGNRKGVLTRDRRPKLAAHFLRRRWNAIPNFDYKG